MSKLNIGTPAAWATLCAALVAAWCLPARATPLYSDGTFNDAQWSLSNYNYTTTFPGGGTSVAAQVQSGGNSGEYRQLTITVNDAVGQASVNGIYALNLRNDAVYDPSISGPIGSMDWSLDGQAYGSPTPYDREVGPLLLQNGKYFVCYAGGSVVASSWVQRSGTGLTRSSFYSLIGSGQLDFSASAPPITLGFYEFCFTQTHVAGYTAVTGIDNWSISVTPAPEPSSMAVILLAVASKLALSRRGAAA